MQTLFGKVDAIELKTRQLLHKLEGLKRENEFLLKENIRLKKDINQYTDKIEGLKKRIGSIDNDSTIDKEAIKQRISKLTEEVELCIKLLNT